MPCDIFFSRLRKRFGVDLPIDKENEEILHEYLESVDQKYENTVNLMSDEKIWEIYLQLFKNKKKKLSQETEKDIVAYA